MDELGDDLLLLTSRPDGTLPVPGKLRFGLPGAAIAVILTGLALVYAGHRRLAKEGRQPAWHHHLAKPLLASVPMVLICLTLRDGFLPMTIVAGGSAYLITLAALGGLRRADIKILWRRG